MAVAHRPDGVEIYWESQGEGPPVVIVQAWGGHPDTLEALIGDLSADHELVTFHPRGVGRSTHVGPYEVDTDAGDLAAVLEDVGGGPALAITLADGTNRALHLAARRPDLLDAVVSPSGVPLTSELLEESTSLASPSVRDALLQQLRSDYRGAMRTIVSSNNPQMDEDEIRDRVAQVLDYYPQEAAVGRFEAWLADDPADNARALGDRLVVLVHEGNPWFPPDLARRALEYFPEMTVVDAEDGVLSRPDLTASAVRELTRARV